jgi:hypothetical protein
LQIHLILVVVAIFNSTSQKKNKAKIGFHIGTAIRSYDDKRKLDVDIMLILHEMSYVFAKNNNGHSFLYSTEDGSMIGDSKK